ncbi:hypothetical protein Taro_034904 [Colocasia esculenta]|uniref:Cystatin domain-containing protein n=1 Tax=Colocasia esculenta TaxID=4460 RepID=A0A843W8Y2_COLES|nr:hypothetical protein [Colocasia esculenta]
MRTQPLLHLVFLLSVASAVADQAMEPKVGAYETIKNVGDPYIVEVSRFAVAEHNRQAGEALVFVGVVSGDQQVVAGMNYKVVVEAEDAAGARKAYEAVGVGEIPEAHFLQAQALISKLIVFQICLDDLSIYRMRSSSGEEEDEACLRHKISRGMAQDKGKLAEVVGKEESTS